MKHLKRIFESSDVSLSLDQIKDVFQDLSDIVDLSITDEYFAENYDVSKYTTIDIGDGNTIERIGYLVRIKDEVSTENFRLISNVFDCLDKSIQLIKSFDPSMEIYIRRMDDSIIPDIYLLKEENAEEIARHKIKNDVDYIVYDINNTPSKKKISKFTSRNHINSKFSKKTSSNLSINKISILFL